MVPSLPVGSPGPQVLLDPGSSVDRRLLFLSFSLEMCGQLGDGGFQAMSAGGGKLVPFNPLFLSWPCP